MATTVSPAIANNIGLASTYLPILDEIYKADSKTAILDTAQDRVRWSDEYRTFYLFETDMVGLGDYSRNGGFVRGDVTASWRAYTPQWDRARQFLVDVADNNESLGLAFGTLGGDFMRTKVRFRMVGRRGDLSTGLRKVIEALEQKTAHFEREFIAAISYGGRAEIVDAANAAIEAGGKVTEETFRRYLYAPDVPDPDLVIRTSGELRTSNFLLWESAYAEYYFTDTLWPDFSEKELDAALESYAARHRRKGGI